MSEIWTIKKLLDWSGIYFEKHRILEGKLNAQWLLSHVLKCGRMDLFLQFDRELTPAELQTYKALILRRIKHEPLQYIMGEADFMGRLFKVSPAVLIPRLDTEVLVEQAMKWLKNNKVEAIIDMGTGSGIVAITLAMVYPGLPIMATDISTEALAVAKENAKKYNVSILFEKGSWPNSIPGTGTLLVVTNPPYIAHHILASLDPEVKDHEPRLALCGGADGLVVIRQVIDDICASGRNVVMMMEIGYDQGASVKGLLTASKFTDILIISDYEGRDRVVVGSYTIS